MELQHTLKTHVALNLIAYNKFYVNRAFIELSWLRCDPSKVVLILNEYLNKDYDIISLRYLFGAQTNLKKSISAKTKSL